MQRRVQDERDGCEMEDCRWEGKGKESRHQNVVVDISQWMGWLVVNCVNKPFKATDVFCILNSVRPTPRSAFRPAAHGSASRPQ